jgi:hypothetical protein
MTKNTRDKNITKIADEIMRGRNSNIDFVVSYQFLRQFHLSEKVPLKMSLTLFLLTPG